ncbi:MAG TPA: NTP transferase domain-containing protein [Gaiellaceae bacterium]|nr:NTP transferase domain-containing protein [Gaiellaceae bacterium]
MATIVVPFRGRGAKQRLAPLGDNARAAVAEAMLADVLAACAGVGPILVVAPSADAGAVEQAAAGAPIELVPDPGRGQGAAVSAALARVQAEPVLIVNGDLPCATARDLLALLGALPAGGLALVEAADATTNALALATPSLFEPVYGSDSAARFRALAPTPAAAQAAAIPNLIDDVDTLDDLRRLAGRLGPRTAEALAASDQRTGAAA